MGIILTVSDNSQVTLGEEVLEHLGVKPGDQLEVEMLQAGRVQIRPRPGKPVASIFGMMKRRAGRAMTIEEIKEAAEAGWSGER